MSWLTAKNISICVSKTFEICHFTNMWYLYAFALAHTNTFRMMVCCCELIKRKIYASIHCCGIIFFSYFLHPVWLIQLTILWFVGFVEISVAFFCCCCCCLVWMFALMIFNVSMMLCVCYHLLIINAETLMNIWDVCGSTLEG